MTGQQQSRGKRRKRGQEAARAVLRNAKNPDEFFRKMDRRVLSLVGEYGGDLSRVTTISFWLYFPTSASAEKAAAELRRNLYDVEVVERSGYEEWICVAYREMTPDADELGRIRTAMTALARSFGGKYDGWEMVV